MEGIPADRGNSPSESTGMETFKNNVEPSLMGAQDACWGSQ